MAAAAPAAPFQPRRLKPNPMATTKPNIPIAAKFQGPGPAAYGLPGEFGHRNPAYSFGIKLKHANQSIGPGPSCFFPKVNRNGAGGGPAFSIQGAYKKCRKDGRAIVYASRPDAAVDLDTPGPAKYNPGDTTCSYRKTPPQYTIVGRHEHSHVHNTPGPAEYGLASTIGVRQQKFNSAPQYSIQPARPHKMSDCFSPGPAAYSPVKPTVTHKNAPVHSLGARWKHKNNDQLPGPGAYKIMQGDMMTSRGHAPSYSFRIKHSEFEVFAADDPQYIADCD